MCFYSIFENVYCFANIFLLYNTTPVITQSKFFNVLTRYNLP